LRTRPAADPIKFTVDKTKLKNTNATPLKQQNGATTTAATSNVEAVKATVFASTQIVVDKENTAPGVVLAAGENGVTTDAVELPNSGQQEGGLEEIDSNASLIEQLNSKLQCSRQNKEACLMCSS
jgi:hypothetical protein